MKAKHYIHTLQFISPVKTSRNTLATKDAHFIIIEENGIQGIGECGMLQGLSYDDRPDFVGKIEWACANINQGLDKLYAALMEWPSIQFALEQAFAQLNKGGKAMFFDTPFSRGKAGIPINGLIWMGDEKYLTQQIEQKLDEGFRCLKMKIGAITWYAEYKILKNLRNRFDALDLEIRVDANGAFNFSQAEKVLHKLAELEIHSIEQPIKPGQWEEMAALVEDSLVPIALDEELIGITNIQQKRKLLNEIQPDYLILKPSFIGGWRGADEWIALAEDFGIDWWATSALESNIGLNAIAQWASSKRLRLPQGLGTGALFQNNIEAPLAIKDSLLWLVEEFSPRFKI